ncbi:hypothetical protein [Reichenbachiella ulvae]|uniref:Uncharacterized protein n=1 Tax=Reichenbachiella ulvae TaxID=2980104 RepID=A0ABT3CVK2_9BACT|nr:hypothetical protein [Reichenbachiella ulvae]MCV9387725.1 hypothetical protein [Reichenbachiella ulvae]
MKILHDISKRNALILILGMLVGIAVIGQPIAKEYIKHHQCCELKKESSDEKQEDRSNEQEEISALEAVAPAAQIQVTSIDYDLLDTEIIFRDFVSNFNHDFVEKLPQKLLRVLFNFIISPNAP